MYKAANVQVLVKVRDKKSTKITKMNKTVKQKVINNEHKRSFIDDLTIM